MTYHLPCCCFLESVSVVYGAFEAFTVCLDDIFGVWSHLYGLDLYRGTKACK